MKGRWKRAAMALAVALGAIVLGLVAYHRSGAPEPASDAGADPRTLREPLHGGPRRLKPPRDDGGLLAASPERPSRALVDRWAHEQPPPEYMGEPSDAGRARPPPPRPEPVEPMDPAELRARQRQTVALLSSHIADLESSIAIAEERGNEDYAMMLRARLEQQRARHDQLLRLLE